MDTACPYSPVPIPSGLRPSPLDKGSRPPGPPFYGGPNQADLAVIAKARVAQSTGFCSITAAAECPVTFGSCFYQLEARL